MATTKKTAKKKATKSAKPKATKTPKGKPSSKPAKARKPSTRGARTAKPKKAARAVNGKGRPTGTKPKKATKKAAPKARNKAPKKGKAIGRQRNSSAPELYEEFHGTPATGSKEHRREIEYRDQLAELGTLKRLDVLTPGGEWQQLDFTGPVKVCSEPNGHSLYFIGGNQKLPLDQMDLGEADLKKDHLTIGQCSFIVYRTSKGFHDFEVTDYGHEFGEEGGELPTLNYDQLNNLIYLTGGSYKVRPEGITD